mmetsp:Transcript_18617/g.40318  ORF Transcript_18617/g.40318 Transcript_18617/m.40318 type:complete len:262 (-) Transcript_18617:1473-2258(-)
MAMNPPTDVHLNPTSQRPLGRPSLVSGLLSMSLPPPRQRKIITFTLALLFIGLLWVFDINIIDGRGGAWQQYLSPADVESKQGNSSSSSGGWGKRLGIVKTGRSVDDGDNNNGDDDDEAFRLKIERSFPSKQTIFTGAKEWSDYWTNASTMSLDSHDDDNDDDGNTYHKYDDYVADRSKLEAGGALQHFNDMKDRYQSLRALPDFYAHGLGWVEDRLGMVFAIIVAGDGAIENNNITLEEGTVSVFIVDTILRRSWKRSRR